MNWADLAGQVLIVGCWLMTDCRQFVSWPKLEADPRWNCSRHSRRWLQRPLDGGGDDPRAWNGWSRTRCCGCWSNQGRVSSADQSTLSKKTFTAPGQAEFKVAKRNSSMPVVFKARVQCHPGRKRVINLPMFYLKNWQNVVVALEAIPRNSRVVHRNWMGHAAPIQLVQTVQHIGSHGHRKPPDENTPITWNEKWNKIFKIKLEHGKQEKD